MDWYFTQKSLGKCIICNESRSDVLEYHHIDPSIKTFSIYSAILEGKKLSVIKKEISKCVFLCSVHHRLYHKKELYIDEKILYDFHIFIKYEHHEWDDIDNLNYLLNFLSPDQIKFVNEIYDQNFYT